MLLNANRTSINIALMILLLTLDICGTIIWSGAFIYIFQQIYFPVDKSQHLLFTCFVMTQNIYFIFIYLFVYLFIYLSIYLFTYLFIYLFIWDYTKDWNKFPYCFHSCSDAWEE